MIVYYITINIIAFFSFLIDKYKAIHHSYRISEKALFYTMILGGCIGSIIAMLIFNHKTKKAKFYIINILSLFIHTILISYLLF